MIGKPMSPYEQFMKALEHTIKNKYYRQQNVLAAEAKISEAMLSNILKGVRQASFKTQTEIAKAAGYNYEDFLALGRQLKMGVSEDIIAYKASEITAESPKPIPIDLPTKLLHEVLEETNIKLNETQKRIVVKYLKNFLKEKESDAKKIAKDLIKSMPYEGGEDGGPEEKSKKSAD